MPEESHKRGDIKHSRHSEEQHLQSAECRLKTQAVCKTFQPNEDTFNANVVIGRRSIPFHFTNSAILRGLNDYPPQKDGKNSCRLTRGEVGSKRRKVAFTLAEVLITLGIIGVVAAITIPTLIKNYQKQVTVTKLQKAYSNLANVAQKAIADNGPVNFKAGELVTADVSKDFFDTYWLQYFKGASVYPDRTGPKLNDGRNWYKLFNGGWWDTSILTDYWGGRVLFTSSDGVLYNIHILSWNNKYDDAGKLISQTGVYSSNQSVYVDINGIKPPNTFGKDVFIFRVDFDKMQVLPDGFSSSQSVIDAKCKSFGTYCAAKIMRDGWKIKY